MRLKERIRALITHGNVMPPLDNTKIGTGLRRCQVAVSLTEPLDGVVCLPGGANSQEVSELLDGAIIEVRRRVSDPVSVKSIFFRPGHSIASVRTSSRVLLALSRDSRIMAADVPGTGREVS